jgi:hypothetical protein
LHPTGEAFAMRYVVLITMAATFVLWDAMRNDSRFIHQGGRFLVRQIERVL